MNAREREAQMTNGDGVITGGFLLVVCNTRCMACVVFVDVVGTKSNFQCEEISRQKVRKNCSTFYFLLE